MKHILKMLAICSALFLSHLVHAANNSPVGYWKTIDDVTSRPKSILKISETPEHVLYGQVVKIYPSPGKTENEVCDKCKGDRHNKRIVGMIIMEGLRQSTDNPNEWSEGSILDPKNGETYRCTLQVNPNGLSMNVRGYLGLSMFGRTQTWLRVERP